MLVDLSRALRSKRVEVVILGAPISPDHAHEIIRRTDILFQFLAYFPVSDKGQTIRNWLGFPVAADYAAAAVPRDDLKRAIAQWRATWSSVDLEWLFNHQMLGGKGWCHGDGTLAFADELEDFPTGDELFNDCRQLAKAFPDLTLDIAAWGQDHTILGFPLLDAPVSRWPAELLGSAYPPTLGFMLRQGNVEVVRGADLRLFQHFGLHYPEAVEVALREVRRCSVDVPHMTAFENQESIDRIPANVIDSWIQHARSLGLVE